MNKKRIDSLQKNDNKLGYFEIILAGVMWSFIGVFLKEMEKIGCTEEVATSMRFGISFAIYFIYTASRYGLKSFLLPAKTIVLYAIFSFLCFGLNSITYMYSVMYNGVALSAVILNLNPIFTALIAYWFLKEKSTLRKSIGIIVNIVGCIIAVTGGNFSLRGLTVIGIVMGVASALLYGITPAGIKISYKEENLMVFNTYCMFFGAVTIALWLKPWESGTDFGMNTFVWSIMYALVCTVASNIVYIDGTGRVTETSKIPVFASVETLLSVVWGMLFYKEAIGLLNLVGVAMVMLSVALISEKNSDAIMTKEE